MEILKLKSVINWSIWVAQSVKHLTLAQVMSWFMSSSPAWDPALTELSLLGILSLSLSLSLPLPHFCMCTLSQINFEKSNKLISNSKLDAAEERIDQLDNRLEENMQTKAWEEKMKMERA